MRIAQISPAVSLYAEASQSAQQSPVLATSLSPFDGMLVPTLGSFYVGVTLLFPFVAIRALGSEKETGALRLLVQLPYGSATLVTAKLVAIASAWLLCAIPALSALAIWTLLGGHLGAAETLNLLVGQLLYGLLIGAIALFAAAIADSSATAAIITLAFTIGSWVLDFTFAGNPGLLGWISRLSLTQTLRTFEQGLLSIGLIVGMLAVVCGFAALAAVWLPPGSDHPHEASALGDLHRSGSTCCCRGRADPPVRRRDGGPAQFVPQRRCAGARKPHGTADRDGSPRAGRPPLCRPQSQRARQA